MGFFNIVVVLGIVITVITCIPVFTQMRHHPKGLHILFFAEMWERFSYYGMRGLLIFYLTQHFLFDDNFSQGQYGTYTSLVYLLPLIGGMLADQFLGTRKAIAFGALLLVAGHFLMGVEGKPAQQQMTIAGETYLFDATGTQAARRVTIEVGDTHCAFNPPTSEMTEGQCTLSANKDGDLVFTNLPETAPLPAVIAKGDYSLEIVNRSKLFVNIFYLALAFIIMGVGFLKANISSIVGELYNEGDPRRDPGFTLYYYGINLGAFWASVLCGVAGQTFGWWAGFGLAGVGMAFGWLVFTQRRLLFFIPGEKQLPDTVGLPPEPEKLKKAVFGPINLENFIYICGLIGVAVVWFLVQRQELTGGTLAAGFVLFGGYMIWFMATQCNRKQVEELLLAMVLIVGAIIFFTLFEQAGSSMNQFAGRNTALPNEGFLTVTAAQTQSFNAGFILLFAPVFAGLWSWLGNMNKDPNTVLKFGLALGQVGLGFLILAWGVAFADADYKVPLIFLMLAYMFHTTGELFLSPVGLSAITKLSPMKVVSFMMAGWFLASAAAQYVAGIIAQLTASETVAGQVLDPAKALETYRSVFTMIGWWGVGLGVLFAVCSFWLKKLGHGKAGHLGHAMAVEAGGPRVERSE